MTNAIILSAGQGRRLLPLTEDRPKCLLKVGEQTLLQRQVGTLLQAGIKHIGVVAGYNVGMVREHLAAAFPQQQGIIEVIFNPFYEVADNLASCWMARAAMRDDFLLINGDTLFEKELLETVIRSASADITLTTDHKTDYDEDDMKVELQGEQVCAVSKLLPAGQTHAESIGLLYFSANGGHLFRERLELAMQSADNLRAWFLAVIDTLAKDGHVRACPVNGRQWCEIDFPADLQAARAMFD
ncbi:MAG: sugar phosphate nucleotidyltransferase [Gammaproteobacteria bacterium]